MENLSGTQVYISKVNCRLFAMLMHICSGEGASEAPLKTDKLRPHCKPLIDDVDKLISKWLKDNYPDCDYEGTYSRQEVYCLGGN